MSNQFKTPMPVSKAELAFGGDVDKFLPAWDDIPDEFKQDRHPFNKIISTWFFKGLPKDTDFEPTEGIDPQMALNHVTAIMKSWAPKHEHKTAGCAYLLSLWFKSITTPKEKGK